MHHSASLSTKIVLTMAIGWLFLVYVRCSRTVPTAGRSGRKAEIIMSKKNYSVGPHQDGWQVKRDGASRASGVFDTKQEAQNRGRELAKETGGELRIKGQDGRIQNSNTYGPHDPMPPRDRKH